MKTTLIRIIAVCCMLMSACGKELKIEVSNQDGTPVSGADVKVDYVDGGALKIVKGTTNEKGVFISNGEKVAYRVEVFVEKNGYYTSKFRHQYATALPKDAEGVFKVTLRKKGKMVPLCAKRVNMIFPSLKKEYAFDFEAGDWVKPHGKGQRGDVFFWADKSINNQGDREGVLKIRYPNKKDGLLIDKTWIAGSVYQQAKEANSDAKYIQNSDIKHMRFAHKMNTSPPNYNYIFRVRSETDSHDKLLKAHYGRILGGLFLATGFAQDQLCAVRFMYFFNPKSNDLNLEFNPRLNPFNPLTIDERIPEATPRMGSRK